MATELSPLLQDAGERLALPLSFLTPASQLSTPLHCRNLTTFCCLPLNLLVLLVDATLLVERWPRALSIHPVRFMALEWEATII
jgi:hypothetical protein